MKRKILLTIAISGFLASSSFASVENANFLAERWIIVNKSNNPVEYRLKNSILRQEAGVVALWLHGWKAQNFCEWKFRDVSATRPNSWACKTIEALEKYDIISDDNIYFRPEAKITKSEVLWMFVKAALEDEYDYDSDNVALKWNWQKQIVDFAASRNLVQNFRDYNSYATRDFVFDVWANILRYKNSKTNSNNQENSIFNINNLEKYNNSPSKVAPTNNSNNTDNNFKLSAEEAKNIALKHSWINVSEVINFKIQKDFENNIPVYEIEFDRLNSRKEYEYVIDARKWTILKFDFDRSKNRNTINYNNSKTNTTNNSTDNNFKISVEEAKNIALRHAWLNASNIFNLKIEKDFENGVPVYEIDFDQINSRKDFEYVIDARNWQILKFDID